MFSGNAWGTSIWTDFKDKWNGDTYLGAYSTGVIMPDWTHQPHTSAPTIAQVATLAGSISGQAFRHRGQNGAGTFVQPYTWNAVSAFTNGEVLIGVCVTSLPGVAASRIGGSILRWPNGVSATYRSGHLTGGVTGGNTIGAWAQAGGIPNDSSVAYALSTNVFYWIRTKATGNLLQVRIWPRGTVEPGTWNTSLTSALTLGAGLCGVNAGIQNLTEIYFDFFSVSTDGTPAWGPV